MKSLNVSVLVVGAGPVGLGFGLDLGWRGVDCLLIDREADRTGAINLHPRAAAITPRTMEFCRRWGVGQAVHESGFPKDLTPNIVYCTSMQGPTVVVQHFPAMRDRKPLHASPEQRERCPQIWFDPILEQGLSQYPHVEMRRPWQLESFTDLGDHVHARITDLASGQPIEVRCQYLIACDGPTSQVRDALGIATTGPGVLSYSINVILDIPDFLSHHDKGAAERYMFLDERGVWAELTVIDGRDRWRLGYAGTQEALDRAHLDIPGMVERVLGAGVPYQIAAISPWRRREAIADRFRSGRVFLAGDAAHTIPPNLGMGMNTGMGDVVNLGWKLEAALKGWAGAALLDSYDAERRPVAIHTGAVSTQTYRRWMTATVDYTELDAPDAAGARARQRVAEFIEATLPDGWDTLGLQLGYRYDDSPICLPDGTPPPPPGKRLRDFTPTARPGASAPHAWLADGRSLLDLFGRGFVLLRLAGEVDVSALVQAAQAQGVPLSVVDVEQPDIAALYERRLVLVRPDAHVAWRGDELPTSDAEDLLHAVCGGEAKRGNPSVASQAPPISGGEAAAARPEFFTDFRYLKPGYVALNVTDLDRSIAFYRDLVGLHLEDRAGDDMAYLRCGADHHNLVLYRAPTAGIRRMAFQLESPRELAKAQAHIQALGWPLTEVAATEAAALRQGTTLRFALPHSGLTFELYAEIAQGRDEYIPTLTQIQRLGHVVIRCANRDAVLDTLTGQLNFRVSDYFGDQVAFLRCHPNPYHHSFGVSRADSDGLHHVNFMVRDVDDIGRAMNRMRKAGVEIVYGPGRHDISNSIFLYYLDPDGMTVEFSCGMEEFPEAQAREPRRLPPLPEILDAWGGLPAAAFGKTGVLHEHPDTTGEAR